MGAFWTYFRDKLAWPQIFRPGPMSALLEGLSRSLDAAREDILWFRRQFSPVTCEDQYVDRHARSRRIKRFPTETDAQYRARVCKAYGWHLLGGKQAGMPQIFEAYGYDVAVASLRPEDEERFAEFRLVVSPEQPVAAGDTAMLTDLANTYKRASSKLATIQLTGSSDQSLSLGILVRQGEQRTIPIQFNPTPGEGQAYLGMAVRVATRQTVGLPRLALTVQDGTAYLGMAVRVATQYVIPATHRA
jgi:hypothetical protein